MLFNSYVFVLFFLPLTLIGYFLCNRLQKHTIAKIYLLGMSLWFYAYFNIKYLPIIVGSILLNFAVSWALHRIAAQKLRLIVLTAALLANLWVLFYFKYFDFFATNLNIVFQTDFILRNLILPLGISFFTFQQLSYVIDSYYRKVPDYHFLDYALFVTFFPQLIAGPIVTHDEIVPQFADEKNLHFSFDNFSKGMYAFAFGLAKKVLIADTFGRAVTWGYGNVAQLDSTNALIVMLAYTMQIYFDFSGYCDMATGLGLMFNIDIPMNFNSPYKALTITEFWNRWHITLTRFFTRYIYIPLGGNRKGAVRTYCNILVVFFVSGLWHGANWTFILWGLMHGVFSVITRLFSNFFKQLHPALNWLLTFTFVNVTWVYFRAASIAEANQLLKTICKLQLGPLNPALLHEMVLPEVQLIVRSFHNEVLLQYAPLFFASLFLAALVAILAAKNTNERLQSFRPTIPAALLASILIVWSVLSFAGVSTFLYFNF